jgi:hypothetical protein
MSVLMAFPGTRLACLPDYPPAERIELLDARAVLVTGGDHPAEPRDTGTLLAAYAHPSLNADQRDQLWDSVLTWVKYREEFAGGTGAEPSEIGVEGGPGSMEEAQNVSAREAASALSALVYGNQAARGTGVHHITGDEIA